MGKGDRRRRSAERRREKSRKKSQGAKGVYRLSRTDKRFNESLKRWGLSPNYPGTNKPRPTRPTEPYDRTKHYGGSQTDHPVGDRIRREFANKPCPSCRSKMVPGSDHRPVPEHDPPLVVHYYDHGGFAMTDEERRTYARSEEAFNGAFCLQCQRKQGHEMAKLSQRYKKKYGL